MKLLFKGKCEIPNQTCSICKNVYEVSLDDLRIGLFGMDEKEFVTWTCPCCGWENRSSELDAYMSQVAAARAAKVPPPAHGDQ